MYINISDAIKKAEKESEPRPDILETVAELKEMQQTFKRGCGGNTLRAYVQHLEFTVFREIETPLTKIVESSKKVKKQLKALYYLVEALDTESTGPVSISPD